MANNEDVGTLLSDAVRDGSVDTVRTLINAYGLAFSPIGGYHLLLNAISMRHTEIAEILLDHGAAVNLKYSSWLDTSLHVAVNYGYLKIAEMLLNKGARTNAVVRFDETVLISAIRHDNVNMLKLLVNHGVDLNVRRARDGALPLYLAAKAGSVQVVRFLYGLGVDIDACTKDYLTPLYIAARHGHLVVVKQLLQYRPNVDIKGNKEAIYVSLKANPKCLGIVESLLEYGFIFDAQQETNSPFLHHAVAAGSLQIVQDLIKHGADVNRNDVFLYSFTPLHVAARHDQHVPLKVLLENGASVHTKDTHEGSTPLHLAESPEVVQTLLEFGAEINARNNLGQTPLHVAALQGNSNIVESLLKSGAALNSRDNGETPLHVARKTGVVIELLLEYGVDVNIKNENHETPLAAFLQYFTSIPQIQALLFHINKMLTAKLYVCEENLQGLLTYKKNHPVDERELAKDSLRYEEELVRMKNVMVANCSINFYDILTKKTSLLAITVGNENVAEVFNSIEYESEFPNYASLLKSRFRLAVHRKGLMDKACDIFDFLFNEVLVKLPTACVEEIIGYLSSEDLQIFVNCFNQFSTCKF